MFIDIKDKNRERFNRQKSNSEAKLKQNSQAMPEESTLIETPKTFVGGYRVTSRGYRLVARLIDYALAGLTLFIGWAIWSLFTWREGTTPGHKILGQKVVLYEKEGMQASWGRMFLREFVIRTLFHILDFFTFGLMTAADSLLIIRQDKRTLHDLMAGTIVVDDPNISLLKRDFFNEQNFLITD